MPVGMLVLFDLAEKVVLIVAERPAHPVILLLRDAVIQFIHVHFVKTALELIIYYIVAATPQPAHRDTAWHLCSSL